MGRDFLGRNRCALVFNAQGGELQVGGQATALLPREPGATPGGVSGLEPQEALQAGRVPEPGGSLAASAQGGGQEYAEPYRQGRGEPTPMEIANQVAKTQAEP